MSIACPTHFIPVFAANIHITAAQLSVSQVPVFLYTSRCVVFIAFPSFAASGTDPCSCLCVDFPIADLIESYWRKNTCFFFYVLQLLEFKCDAGFITASCEIKTFPE